MPSSPVRTRVTAAAVAARRPAGPSTPSIDVPTQKASALNASANPFAPPAISSPRCHRTMIAWRANRGTIEPHRRARHLSYAEPMPR